MFEPVILNDDIEILNSVSYIEKINSINVKKDKFPLIDFDLSIHICDYFKNKIGYTNEASFKYLDNGGENILTLPNLYFYETKDEVLEHFSDKSKYYYFHLVLLAGDTYILYIYEKCNIRKYRSSKFKKLGI